MSGLSLALSSLAGVDGTRRKPHCLRALVCAPVCVPASCVCASLNAGRLCKYAGFRAHTWCAHTCWCGHACLCSLGGVLAEACCGRVCSWVVGLRFFVFAWVFALSGCWRFGGVVGRGCPAAPLSLAVLWWAGFWRSRSGVGVKSVWASAWATSMGRDVVVPPLCGVVALLLPLLCARGRERGSHRPGVLAWLGAGCVSGASALVAGTIPWWREREVGIASSCGACWAGFRPGACWPGRGWLRSWW